MGRRKKVNRVNEHQCFVCSNTFEAVRDDARYCSAKCRKKISRAMALLNQIDPKHAKKKGKQWKCQNCQSPCADRAELCAVCQREIEARTARRFARRREEEQARDVASGENC